MSIAALVRWAVAVSLVMAGAQAQQGEEGSLKSRGGQTNVRAMDTSASGIGTVASVTFIGFDATVPGNTTLQLSFTPAFEQAASLLRGSTTHNPKASADLPTGQDGLMVPVVFTARGRDAILNSTCGRYNATTRIFHGKGWCLRMAVKKDVSHDAKALVAALNVSHEEGGAHHPAALPTVVFSNQTGRAVSFHARTNTTDATGYYFAIVSLASVPIKLEHIKVTGTDFKAMVPIADILLPPAETSGM